MSLVKDVARKNIWMGNAVEIRNQGEKKLWASVCISKSSGRMYVHVTDKKKLVSEPTVVIFPNDYCVLEPRIIEG